DLFDVLGVYRLASQNRRNRWTETRWHNAGKLGLRYHEDGRNTARADPKRGSRSRVTEMGWDKGRYYSRSRKVNGRVVREYVGGGRLGQLAAQLDALDRQKQDIERAEQAAARAELDALDGPLNELNELAELLAHAALVAAGYHRHKRGEWRKRRVQVDEA